MKESLADFIEFTRQFKQGHVSCKNLFNCTRPDIEQCRLTTKFGSSQAIIFSCYIHYPLLIALTADLFQTILEKIHAEYSNQDGNEEQSQGEACNCTDSRRKYSVN